MTIQDWGAIGELIGAIAVVASLVYLAIQIRQNTQQVSHTLEASRLAAFERNIESGNRIRDLMIRDPDLAELFLRGVQDFDGLESTEKFRFDLLLRNIFSATQGAYIRLLRVGANAPELESTAIVIDMLLGNPGVRQWLEKARTDWRTEFREFIRERLDRVESRT